MQIVDIPMGEGLDGSTSVSYGACPPARERAARRQFRTGRKFSNERICPASPPGLMPGEVVFRWAASQNFVIMDHLPREFEQ